MPAHASILSDEFITFPGTGFGQEFAIPADTPWPACGEVDVDEALAAFDAFSCEQQADDNAGGGAVAKRVHHRPTVDRLFADFTRPGRLDEAQLDTLTRRCASLTGFRSALHEYIVAATMRRPSLAHNYRYPHPRTLEKMHREFLRAHPAPVSTVYVGGQPVYEALTRDTLAVPL